MSTADTVVIAAGGTGGHIYPAIAVARLLEKRKVPVVWIGTREGLEARIVPEANIDIRFINISGFRGKGLKGFLLGPFKLVRACVQSIRILSQVKAKSVLGMGGFVSGPVGIAALLTRRVLVLHEQNAVAGMTNKWLGRFATRVYSAMPNVFPEAVGANAIGNPVRESIEQLGIQKIAAHTKSTDANNSNETTNTAVANVNNRRSALRVLVIGGSRGAQVLNEVVPKGIEALTTAASELELSVWHQTGPADELKVKDAYKSLHNKLSSTEVAAYIEDVTEAYRWADVIVCRSGAMTVSELSAAALPGVLVPFPHHADNHQTKNAKFLSDSGAAVLLEQGEFNADSLSNTLSALIQSEDVLNKMSCAAQALHKPDAATVVADALLEVSN